MIFLDLLCVPNVVYKEHATMRFVPRKGPHVSGPHTCVREVSCPIRRFCDVVT